VDLNTYLPKNVPVFYRGQRMDVVIGHGASREERQALVSLFREKVPDITIVCLLSCADKPFQEANFNVPADNPAL